MCEKSRDVREGEDRGDEGRQDPGGRRLRAGRPRSLQRRGAADQLPGRLLPHLHLADVRRATAWLPFVLPVSVKILPRCLQPAPQRENLRLDGPDVLGRWRVLRLVEHQLLTGEVVVRALQQQVRLILLACFVSRDCCREGKKLLHSDGRGPFVDPEANACIARHPSLEVTIVVDRDRGDLEAQRAALRQTSQANPSPVAGQLRSAPWRP